MIERAVGKLAICTNLNELPDFDRSRSKYAEPGQTATVNPNWSKRLKGVEKGTDIALAAGARLIIISPDERWE